VTDHRCDYRVVGLRSVAGRPGCGLLYECTICHTRTARPPSRGLGDTVARVLNATGVGPVAKTVITAVTGQPCGCEKRRNLLNKLVPYSKEQQMALAHKDETQEPYPRDLSSTGRHP
jgi:hypothetical protein